MKRGDKNLHFTELELIIDQSMPEVSKHEIQRETH
jgi:hypothetical protein